MPETKQVIVPSENEVWRHKDNFYVVKGDIMVQVCFNFDIDIEVAPDKIRAIHNNIRRISSTMSCRNIADGIANWSFVNEHWHFHLLKMYREKAVKTLAALDKCMVFLEGVIDAKSVNT